MRPSNCNHLVPLALLGLCLSLELESACADSGPAPYTGPVTVVSGVLGGASVPLYQYGTYPATGSVWSYKADFTDTTLAAFISTVGNSWRNESFDHSPWPTAVSQIGYGDATRDEATIITQTDYTTATGVQSGPVCLFRSRFSIADLSAVASVTGTVKFDDSCVVYVNGTEVYRHSHLAANAPLTQYTAPNPTTENEEAPLNIPLGFLHNGQNTIAVEVHQQAATSADMSFDMALNANLNSNAEIHWTLAGSPYHMTGDVTVPTGKTLIIDPGVRVFADATRRLTVNGIIKVLGTAAAPVKFSHHPSAANVANPREPAVLAPPKWGGILVSDSLSPENIIQYAEFYGAQPVAVEGSITVVRAECLVDHCTFCATYLHGVYGKNCSLTVQDSQFPSVFPPGKEALGGVLDNLSEFVEVDSPPTDAGVVGKPEFSGGFPVGGHLRLYRNHFYGSSGHNDLVDITSGKWGVTPILDAQDNHFHGPTGDEHIDLNGDAYIAGNIFENCSKDAYTSDGGYANAISSDKGGSDTTIVVVRNIFTHCDHAVNLKNDTAVIFEHNTVADVNTDYHFSRVTPTPLEQDVKCSAINFYIPGDGGQAGDGAYAAYNLFYGQAGGGSYSRIFGWADLDLAAQPAKTTKIEMTHNFVDPSIQDKFIGSQHPNDVLASLWNPTIGDPLFVNRSVRNYALTTASPAKGSAPHGLDFGASIAPGCYLGTLPPAATANSSAAITVGGPGIFAYRWRLDGQAWNGPVSIGPGVFPRTGATVRTAVLALNGLSNAQHTLEVAGQDFAGNWQSTPTIFSWLVTVIPPLTYHNWLAWHGIADATDADADGLDSLTEFALGTHPTRANAATLSAAQDTGTLTLKISLPSDASLTQGHGRAQISYRVEVSEDLATDSWSVVAQKSPTTAWTGAVTMGAASNGFVPVAISAPSPMSAKQRSFLRLRTIWTP